MTKPCIITVAIIGSVPRKEGNPAVPITVSEQIESTQKAFEAGATIAHVHVRKERFARLSEGLRKHCPGIIIQFSTGGRSGKGSERGCMLYLKPDMASLSTGSCNFPTIIYENHPTLIHELAAKMMDYGIKPEIEVFDLSMLYQALRLAEEGVLSKPLHVQFIFGVKNAMPAIATRSNSRWRSSRNSHPRRPGRPPGLGAIRSRSITGRWISAVIAAPGSRTMFASTATVLRLQNAELVRRVISLCGEYGRKPATAAESRRMLGLN